MTEKKEYKPGDEIIITADGEEFVTVIDDHGVQRFPKDLNHKLMKYLNDPSRNCKGSMDLNQMYYAYQTGRLEGVTAHDWMTFNMALGQSVCNFMDLDDFQGIRIINPLWGDKEDDIPDDSYLNAKLLNGDLRLSQVIAYIKEREGYTTNQAEAYFVREYML